MSGAPQEDSANIKKQQIIPNQQLRLPISLSLNYNYIPTAVEIHHKMKVRLEALSSL
jgi:hypothetical protein